MPQLNVLVFFFAFVDRLFCVRYGADEAAVKKKKRKKRRKIYPAILCSGVRSVRKWSGRECAECECVSSGVGTRKEVVRRANGNPIPPPG